MERLRGLGRASVWVRQLRLATGLILYTYLVSHFLNHALGLVSVAAMEWGLGLVYPFWSSLPVTITLYGALATHFSLALWAVWQRRTLRMPAAQVTQYVLGFSIPLLAAGHVVGTRLADGAYGADFGHYENVLLTLWHFKVESGVQQLCLLVIAWTHASIGLRYWLRLKPGYERARPYLFAWTLLLPTLAILGYAEGGREILAMLRQDPALADRVLAGLPSPRSQAALEAWGDGLRLFVLSCLVLVLGGRVVRRSWQRRRGLVRITYPDGRSIEVVAGTSVLEASRMLGVPHASVCGGKGRCSTCRIRARGAAGALLEPSPLEAGVLKRIHAAPNVRLACQLRPTGPIEATPLLPPYVHAREGLTRAGYLQGREKEIAILFADLRAFTELSEKKLPYDVVFVLNRYFAAMGKAVEEAGGRVDKFIGDGVMALFGIDGTATAGCRAALEAASRMSARLEDLNRSLEHDIEAPLRLAMGIHAGPAIVGEMGWGAATSLTAVGDAVNTASRLESLAKSLDCELVVSEDAVLRAGLDLREHPRREIEIRGRRAMLSVRTIACARDLLAEKAN
jgi:adenylate cyclase